MWKSLLQVNNINAEVQFYRFDYHKITKFFFSYKPILVGFVKLVFRVIDLFDRCEWDRRLDNTKISRKSSYDNLKIVLIHFELMF